MRLDERQELLVKIADEVFKADRPDEAALLALLEELAADFEKNPTGRSHICTTITQILHTIGYASVLDAAENLLIKAANTREKSDFCRVWYFIRHPRLEKIIRERKWKPEKDTRQTWAYTVALKFGYLDWLHKNVVYEWDSRNLVMTLYENDQAIVEQAKIELKKLMGGYRTEAYRTLENTALYGQPKTYNRVAIEFFAETNYKPTNMELLVQVELITGQLDLTNTQFSSASAIEALVSILNFPELVDAAFGYLSKLISRTHIETVCRLIIERPRTLASALFDLDKIAVAAGYEPEDPIAKVFFYFLTRQFDKYEVLDFDKRILRTLYDGASQGQRFRIATIVRESGKLEYLEMLSYKASVSEEQTNQTYVEALFEVIQYNKQWEMLWQKVFELPLKSSQEALTILRNQNWQPNNEYEHELFTELYGLIESEPAKIPALVEMLTPGILRATLRAAGRVNSLAFAPDGARVAVATGNRKVVIWNLVKGERETVLRDFSHSVGKVVFTADGGLLCAERTQGLKACGVYFWDGKSFRRLGEQAGAVTALAALEQGWAASGGNDKRVTIWNIATGEARAVLRLKDTIRQIVRLPELNRLLVFADQVYVYDATSYEELERYGKFYRVINVAAVNANASLVALGDTGGYLELYRMTNSALAKYKPDADFSHLAWAEHSPVRGMALDEQQKLLVKGNANGQLRFVNYEQKKLLGKLALPDEKLTSLELSPDGNFMATGDGDTSFGLWDLRPLAIIALLEQPLSSATARHMAALKILQDENENLGLSPATRNALKYIETVLRHRFRYDIEVEFAPNIQPGDFDIELENS